MAVRSTTVAYEPPPPRGPRRRGRPRVRGARVKLTELFDHPGRFRPASVELYGGLKDIRYLCRDLLWHGLFVRFVLSIYPDGAHRILVSTNTRFLKAGYSLAPADPAHRKDGSVVMRRTTTTMPVSMRAPMTGANADRFLSRQQAGVASPGPTNAAGTAFCSDCRKSRNPNDPFVESAD